MSGRNNQKHQRDATNWARAVREQPERYVILDTETTGVTPYDEIIQIAVIDSWGTVLLDQLIRPMQKKYIPRPATAVHGITIEMLQGKPMFGQIAGLLQDAVHDRTVITYNADFDRRLLTQTAGFAGVALPPVTWECAMLRYAEFVGDWDDYHGNYRWHKLRGGDHTALGDCKATLAHIREMAESVP